MRTASRALSTLLALVLLAGGLLIVVQTVSAVWWRPWPLPLDEWHRTLRTATVADTAVLATSIAVAAVGLVLLVGALVPTRPQRLPATPGGGDSGRGDSTRGDSGDGNWWVSRRSVERRVADAAIRGGADRPKVVARGSRERWQVRLSAKAPPHRREAVEAAVWSELRSIGAPDDAAVSLALTKPGRVA